jgi:hypothetical protein
MGCSSTKNISPATLLPIEQHDPITVPIDALSNDRMTRYIENCIVVWLAVPSVLKEHQSIAEKLRQVIYTLRTFNNPNECITFMENIRDEKIFLVVSPEMEQAVRSIHYLPQLEKIYVFHTSSEKMDHAVNQLVSTKIFRDINELCEQLRQDVYICELDLIHVIVVPAETQSTVPISISTKQTAMFLCTQFIKMTTLRIKFENKHKDVFIDYCRKHYTQLLEQVQVLNDFDNNYRPKNVLWWITNPCFVSRILHRVLRTYDIDVMYKMSFLFRHIHTQLILLHEKTFSLMKDHSIVYRGKTMSNDEFDTLVKNNCGGLLCFSNFLTANIHKNHVMDFICRRIDTHPKMTAILFEIHLDLTIQSATNVYALLDNTNTDLKSEEGEVFFTMGTVFRIESVEQVTDNATNLWTVKLRFIDDNDPHFHRLVAPLSAEIDYNSFSCVGKLLIEMGACDRAEQFYLDLLNDPSVLSLPRRLVRLQNALGVVFTYKGEHMKAVEHYQMSLKTSLSYMSPDHPELAVIYKTIGSSYFNNHNYVEALQNYEKSAQLVKGSGQQADESFLLDLNDCIAKTRELLDQNR